MRILSFRFTVPDPEYAQIQEAEKRKGIKLRDFVARQITVDFLAEPPEPTEEEAAA